MHVYLVMYHVPYEDRWCEGVFSTREKAEAFLRNHGFAKACELNPEEEDAPDADWLNIRPKRHDDIFAYIDEREVDL